MKESLIGRYCHHTYKVLFLMEDFSDFGLSSILLEEDKIFRFLCFYSKLLRTTLFKKEILEIHKFFIQNFQSQSLLRFMEMITNTVKRFYLYYEGGGRDWVSFSWCLRWQCFSEIKLFFCFSSFVFPLCMLPTLDFVLTERVFIFKPMWFGCIL